MPKKTTKEEKDWIKRVASLPCYVYANFEDRRFECNGRVEVHHKTGAGVGLRSSHFDTMPLCNAHHSAQTRLPFGYSVHKGTKSFEKRYATQDEMILWVKEKLEGME